MNTHVKLMKSKHMSEIQLLAISMCFSTGDLGKLKRFLSFSIEDIINALDAGKIRFDDESARNALMELLAVLASFCLNDQLAFILPD